MIVLVLSQMVGVGRRTLAFYLAREQPRHAIHPAPKPSAPAMRGRIKLVALQDAVIVTDSLRELLARDFTADPGE